MQSNDNMMMRPITDFGTPNFMFEFDSFRIGVAEYEEGPTGCTVFHFPQTAMMSVDVRGGAVGVLGAHYDWVEAISLAGGSLYGLEAATGVAAELFAQNEFNTYFEKIALVAGAIIFDFGSRENAVYPDKALGRAAMKAAKPGVFPIGSRGAGISATVGKGLDFTLDEWSGQGAAFGQIGATKVAVFTVVNAIGAIVDRDGDVVRGHLNRQTGERIHAAADLERMMAAAAAPKSQLGNTTPTVLITNQKLSRDGLRQLGRQVHSSMARAVQPFHTIYDGDVLFAVSTGEVENKNLNEIGLGIFASEVAWDAVLSVAKAGLR
jgi:L-aminopeptidase/D-esterase-like protein